MPAAPVLVVSRRAGGTRAPAQYHLVRVDRASPLGNPFPMLSESDRDSVCDRYAVWFEQQLAAGNPSVTAAFKNLMALHRRGEPLALECWCAPKRCHADTLREAILRKT